MPTEFPSELQDRDEYAALEEGANDTGEILALREMASQDLARTATATTINAETGESSTFEVSSIGQETFAALQAKKIKEAQAAMAVSSQSWRTEEK